MTKKLDFTIPVLGEPKIQSPIYMGEGVGDGIADYVTDDDVIYYSTETRLDDKGNIIPKYNDVVQLAGPRRKIYFNPVHTHAAICTCGGICPGLNNVIRAIVRCLWFRYGVKVISGIRYGYKGLLSDTEYSVMRLTPDVVDDIQSMGGTILGSARGGGKRVEEIVDSLERMNVNILFTIGGDGTLRGAYDISQEIKRRGLKISVVGIPKTIDNDLSFIQTSFGVNTAVSKALPAVEGAHVEAKNSINGIGLVKVMGRESGFIAANASLAQSDVNFCLIPECSFDLDGQNGLLEHLRKRLKARGHAVILVAEGAGQELLPKTHLKDASGNEVYGNIGHFLKEEMSKYFKKINMEVNIKYIDPSYIIRSAPANSYDSIYCARLGSHAVHAAMAGKTETLISMLNDKYVHIPIPVAVSSRNHIDIEGSLWRDVLENTRQPYSMKN